jgi:hypothetical protein
MRMTCFNEIETEGEKLWKEITGYMKISPKEQTEIFTSVLSVLSGQESQHSLKGLWMVW